MNLFNIKVMSPIVDLSPGLLCHQCSDSLKLIWSGEMGRQTAGLVISTVGQVASVQVLVAWVRLVCVLQGGRWDFGIMWWGVCLHVPALLADSEHSKSQERSGVEKSQSIEVVPLKQIRSLALPFYLHYLAIITWVVFLCTCSCPIHHRPQTIRSNNLEQGI